MKLEFILTEAVKKTAKDEVYDETKSISKPPWYLNLISWILVAIFCLSSFSLIHNFGKQAKLHFDYLVYIGFFIGSIVCFFLLAVLNLKLSKPKQLNKEMKVYVEFGEIGVRYVLQNGVVSEFPYSSISRVIESKSNILFVIDRFTYFFVPISAILDMKIKDEILRKTQAATKS